MSYLLSWLKGQGAITGLDFPNNGDSIGTVQMRFTGADKPPIAAATYIHKIRLRQHTGYYTTFFQGRTDGSFVGNGTYFGCHPYPPGGGGATGQKWEVSADGGDDVTDANGHNTDVVFGNWFTQIVRVFPSGGGSTIEFYWDISDTTKLISHNNFITNGAPLADSPFSPALTYGDAPWNATNERLGGILRGLQIYGATLTLSDALLEAANTTNSPVTAAGIANVWYMNQNPTPGDIADKSSAGHNPAWLTSDHASLWTGP